MVFFCQFCRFSSLEWRTFLRHTFEAHSNVPGFNFMCGVDGCSQTFRTYSGIVSHFRRKHRGQDLTSHDQLSDQQNPPAVEANSSALIETQSEFVIHNVTHPGADVNKLENAAALFLLCLKERFQITQTAVDFAMGQVQQMITFAVKDVQHAVEMHLQSSSPADTSAIQEFLILLSICKVSTCRPSTTRRTSN